MMNHSLGAVGLMYDGLFGSDVRTGEPAPNGLADYWEIAPDGRTYTFYLNKNAKWHDGIDITADDVQFSFDALANPDLGCSYTDSFLEATESWRVIDEHTFEIVAKEPLFTFLYDLFGADSAEAHLGERPCRQLANGRRRDRTRSFSRRRLRSVQVSESGGRARASPCPQRRLLRKVPYIDSYVIRIWPDQTSVINALLNGEIDVPRLEPADVETVKATEGLKVTVYPTPELHLLHDESRSGEVDHSLATRQFAKRSSMRLDRESIVNDILLGYAEVAQGTQPVISYAYAPDQITTNYDYDPEKAKSLLAEAGWTDSDGDGIVDKDGQALAFEMIYRFRFADRRPDGRLHAGCLAGDRRRHDAARDGVRGADRDDHRRTRLRCRAARL